MMTRTNYAIVRTCAFAAMAILCHTACSAQQQSTQVLKFGVYTADKATDVYDQFQPILHDASQSMTKQLGRPIKLELIIGKDYESTLDQLRLGVIDFVRLGPASYVNLKRTAPGIQMIAMEQKEGKKVFYGVLFTRKESPIDSIDDLKGKQMAFGNRQSTIGRYLAQRLLISHGISAETLGGYEYLGRHDLTCAAVLVGDFDAGVAKESTFQKYRDKGVGLKVIARYPNVTKPWVARAGIDRQLLLALQTYLLQLQDRTIMEAYGVSGFTKGSDEDYLMVREAIAFAERFEIDK